MTTARTTIEATTTTTTVSTALTITTIPTTSTTAKQRQQQERHKWQQQQRQQQQKSKTIAVMLLINFSHIKKPSCHCYIVTLVKIFKLILKWRHICLKSRPFYPEPFLPIRSRQWQLFSNVFFCFSFVGMSIYVEYITPVHKIPNSQTLFFWTATKQSNRASSTPPSPPFLSTFFPIKVFDFSIFVILSKLNTDYT